MRRDSSITVLESSIYSDGRFIGVGLGSVGVMVTVLVVGSTFVPSAFGLGCKLCWDTKAQ